MADRDAAGLALQHFYTAPDGNLSRHYKEVAGDGVAYADNDEIYSVHIPQGTLIFDVTAVVSTPVGAGCTFDLGLVQKGPGSFADDHDMFLDGEDMNAVGTHRAIDNERPAPFRVQHPNVFLTITVRDAIAQANASNWRVRLYVDYEYVGTL